MAIKPTTTELRADPRIDWAGLGLADPAPADDTALEEEITVAFAYVEEKTGRDLDTMDPASNLGIIARRAVILRVVQQAVQGRGSYITREIDRQIISFAVPGYSETRASGTTTNSRQYAAGLFNDWPILNDLLWLLATQAKRDEAYSMFLGDEVPASAITSVDWTGRGRGTRGDPFFYG